MNLFEPTLARILVGTVDCALHGSEYALEGWKILRRYTLLGKSVPLGDLSRVIDLLDRAKDDIEGPRIQVDLSQDKVYEINRPAKEVGDDVKTERELLNLDV